MVLFQVTGEENDTDRKGGIHSPTGFAHLFGSQSLQNEKVGVNNVVVVQVGFITADGRGEFLRYEWDSSRVIYKNLKAGAASEVQMNSSVRDKKLEQMIVSLVQAAPTAPVGIDEAAVISSNGSETVWLFEYIDPLGGKQSIVTVENLPKDLSNRNHHLLRKSFEQVVRHISIEKGRKLKRSVPE